MKTITLNFEKWNGGRRPFIFGISRSYSRVYFKGYIWTPFVIVTWRKINTTAIVLPPTELEQD